MLNTSPFRKVAFADVGTRERVCAPFAPPIQNVLPALAEMLPFSVLSPSTLNVPLPERVATLNNPLVAPIIVVPFRLYTPPVPLVKLPPLVLGACTVTLSQMKPP